MFVNGDHDQEVLDANTRSNCRQDRLWFQGITEGRKLKGADRIHDHVPQCHHKLVPV